MYSYDIPNSELIKSLNLQSHPEGGYYAETFRAKETEASPFTDGEERSVTTAIYYLLTPDSPRGKLHKNNNIITHVLQSGRAVYTLIRPTEEGKPQVEKITMGIDLARGEVMQLVVEAGVWKMSELPKEDLQRGDREKTGALVTEVVAPGFDLKDHAFMTAEELAQIFKANPEEAEEFRDAIKQE